MEVFHIKVYSIRLLLSAPKINGRFLETYLLLLVEACIIQMHCSYLQKTVNVADLTYTRLACIWTSAAF